MGQLQNDFLHLVAPAAMATEKLYGVPASITMAQAALETGFGVHMPPDSHNYFGIKATHLKDPETYVEALTPEFVKGVAQHVMQPFEKYPSPTESFLAHAQLLGMATRYQPAMAVRGNPAAFAQQLQKCGYSTNRPPLAKAPPFYADQLLQLAKQYDLAQYDVPPPPAPVDRKAA